jgi:hypothetical protein
MTAPHNLDSLAINTMASGHLCLNMTERVSWEEFPVCAERLVSSIRGEITRKSDGADLRLWEVIINGQRLSLVFDDFPVMVSLESSDDEGDAVLKRLYQELG